MSNLTIEAAAANPDKLARLSRRLSNHPTIEERFQAFHEANPDVYTLLVELARDVKRRGKASYGMKAIFERARWHRNIERGDRDFKLNNIYSAHYARLIEAQEPDLAGFFAKRALRSQ